MDGGKLFASQTTHGLTLEAWHEEYPSGGLSDPTGPAEGLARMTRGGAYDSPADWCRSAERDWRGRRIGSAAITTAFVFA